MIRRHAAWLMRKWRRAGRLIFAQSSTRTSASTRARGLAAEEDGVALQPNKLEDSAALTHVTSRHHQEKPHASHASRSRESEYHY